MRRSASLIVTSTSSARQHGDGAAEVGSDAALVVGTRWTRGAAFELNRATPGAAIEATAPYSRRHPTVERSAQSQPCSRRSAVLRKVAGTMPPRRRRARATRALRRARALSRGRRRRAGRARRAVACGGCPRLATPSRQSARRWSRGNRSALDSARSGELRERPKRPRDWAYSSTATKSWARDLARPSLGESCFLVRSRYHVERKDFIVAART